MTHNITPRIQKAIDDFCTDVDIVARIKKENIELHQANILANEKINSAIELIKSVIKVSEDN